MDQLFDQYNLLKDELVRIEREISIHEQKIDQLEKTLDRMDNNELVTDIYVDRDHVIDERERIIDEMNQLEQDYDTIIQQIKEIEQVFDELL